MSGVSAEPTVYRVGITRGATSTEAWVFDLPGCCAVAATPADVLDVLPVVIAEHLCWLDSHGEVTRNAFPFHYEVVEDVDLTSLAGVADGEFAFADDLQPATTDHVETAVRRMGFARKELLRLVGQLPDTVLDWQPPAAAVKRDDWAPGARSIRAILGHIASAEGSYTRSVGATEEQRGQDIFGQRDATVTYLRSLGAHALGRKFRLRQPWQQSGEENWTVPKALRRIIAHERFHTKEIDQRLAWLLMGMPTVEQPAGAEVAGHARA